MTLHNKTLETTQSVHALTIEPDQNVFDFAQQIATQPIETITLVLPKFTDGRAYSQAINLRKRLKFNGQLRIVGDVLVDQVLALVRIGFDDIQLRHDQSLEAAQLSLSRFSGFYQDSLGYLNLPRESVTRQPRISLASLAQTWSLEEVCPA